MVWPNSERIIISTISKCGSSVALGLDNGTVVVWDLYRGEGFLLGSLVPDIIHVSPKGKWTKSTLIAIIVTNLFF